MAVYVPDESIDIYKNTEGWNVIPYYFELSKFKGADINAPKASRTLSVSRNGNGYDICSEKKISKIICYNSGGQIIAAEKPTDSNVYIESPSGTPLLFIKVNYADGTAETIKIKP